MLVLLAQRRRAQRERAVAGQSVQSPQHRVRHVVHQHVGADQDAAERLLIRPVCTVPRLRETGPGGGSDQEELDWLASHVSGNMQTLIYVLWPQFSMIITFYPARLLLSLVFLTYYC